MMQRLLRGHLRYLERKELSHFARGRRKTADALRVRYLIVFLVAAGVYRAPHGTLPTGYTA